MPDKVSVYKPTNTAGEFVAPTYNSQYQGQLDTALNNVVNFNYDPMKDASYRKMANLYAAKGKQAARDTIGTAASLNGGYGTSYAVSAAQQAQNQYNQELAALIPDYEERAYTRAQGTLSALRDAENTSYSRFRDSVSDAQYQWEKRYQAYRDAMADYEWGMGYNLDIDKYNLDVENSKKYSSSGGGGYTGGGYDSDFIGSVISAASSGGSSGSKKTTTSTKSTSTPWYMKQTAGNEKQQMLNKKK